MTRHVLSGLVLLALLASLTGPALAQPTPTLVYVPLPDAEWLTRFASTGLPAYARLHGQAGDYLLAGADPAGLRALAAAGLTARVLDVDTTGAAYYLAYLMPGRPQPRWRDYGRVLLDDGVQVLMRAEPPAAERLAEAGVGLSHLTLTPKPLHPAQAAATIPTVVQPDPLVQAMIDQVSAPVVYSYTGDLSGEWPVLVDGAPYTIATRHTYSGTPVQKATQYVAERLAARGLTVEYHTWDASRPPNVIGELPGQTNSHDIYIICGHLDDMPSGSLAPGADDNASGAVAVLIAADILTQYQWGCTLRFAFWTGEEQGLLGSAAYAQRCYNRGENIRGVLNLDMIAWNTPASSRDIDLHAKSSLPATLTLAQLFANVVSAYGLNLTPEIRPNGTGASDHASFWTYGYTAILGIEDMGDFNPRYHTTGDQLQYLDMAYYTDFVKAALATFVHMSGCLIPAGTGYLDGHVTASGVPIAGATVTAHDGAGHAFSTTTSAAGYYTHTLLAGTYTVTASAFSYQSTAVAGVAIAANTVTTQDFALTLAPTHTISGTVTEAGAGTPLFAQVTALDTPLAPVWTHPATGFYSLVVPQGAYTLSVMAARHQPAARAVTADHSQTQDFALSPRPCILLVDDDNNDPDIRPAYTAALDALGYDYDVFDVGGGAGNGPTAGQMMGYAIVVWFSGDQFGSGDSAGPNAADEASLAAYLDGGGRLFLSSQDYLFDMGLTAFGRDYLGVGSFTNDAGDATAQYGVPGDPIGNGLGPYPLSYPTDFDDYGDIVNVGTGASAAFQGQNGHNLDVDKAGANWRTVFFGTEWAAIYHAHAVNGQQVLQRIIEWFDSCECDPAHDADFSWTPPTPVVGQVITFTGAATGTGLLTFDWDFGDGATGGGASVVHIYTSAGDYAVTLTATNTCGQDVVTRTVHCVCTDVAGVTLTRASTGTVYPGDVVAFRADLTPDDAHKPYSYRLTVDGAPGPAQTSSNDPLNFSRSVATTGTHTVAVAVWNCTQTETEAVTDVISFVVSPICTDVTSVHLTRTTPGEIYTRTIVQFSADVAPDSAARPYTYSVAVDGGLVIPARPGHDAPLVFTHTFATTGTHVVTVQVWNCDMSAPAEDTIEVLVVTSRQIWYRWYLPLVAKGIT